MYEAEIFDERYHVYRRDRETSSLSSHKKDGGGVLIAVKKDGFNSIRQIRWESLCEDLWVTIELNNGNVTERLHVCAVYIPPPVNRNTLETFINSTTDTIHNNNLGTPNNSILLLGDFNMSSITWTTQPTISGQYASPGNYSSCLLKSSLIDFFALHDLNQYNMNKNSSDKLLDLVLSNVNINVTESQFPIRKVDILHPPLEIFFKIKPPNNFHATKNKCFHNFNRADFDSIIAYLNDIDWLKTLGVLNNVNDMISKFYEILQVAIDKFVPISSKTSKSYPIWFTPALIKLIKQKHKCHNKIKIYNNPLDKIEFSYLRKDCDKLIKQCYYQYIQHIEEAISNNPKYFWSHMKNMRRKSSNYPNKMSLNDHEANSRQEICDLFASHFSSVFVKDDINNYPTVKPVPKPKNYIGNTYFSEQEIKKRLKRLDTTKSAGPDGIPPIFIHRCANSLSPPLTIIFNTSLSTGIFPKKWKEARIVPIFKSENPASVINYRPISILSTFSKVFESLVYESVFKNLGRCISWQQHGFLSGRSTATNLFLYITDLIENVDKKLQVDAIYTDFSKAFDKVNHALLINKMRSFGINGTLLSWCASYLESRSSTVVIDGYFSQPYIAYSGVPQGSNLGPVFFNIFINDIVSIFKHSKIYLFADDLKIVKTIKNNSDVELLQEDLNRLIQWCYDNRMCLNTKKCHLIRFTRKHNYVQSHYHIETEKLTVVRTIRDLGVILDSELKFTDHIDSIVTSATKLLGFVLRNTREFRQPSTTIKLFSSLVRSRLEYCSQIWNPHYRTHSIRIEKLQKTLLRHLRYRSNSGLANNSYEKNLLQYNITSLESRRIISDMIFLYKIVNNNIDCPAIVQLFNLNVPSRLPRKPQALFNVTVYKSNLGKFSPLARLAHNYNDLSSKISGLDIASNSLSAFKSNLVNFFKKI